MTILFGDFILLSDVYLSENPLMQIRSRAFVDSTKWQNVLNEIPSDAHGTEGFPALSDELDHPQILR